MIFLPSHYGHLIRILHSQTDQTITNALAAMELTSSQGHIMGYLAHCVQAPCSRDIEEAFHLSHPTVSGLLSRLEKRGFVKKERDGKINHYSALVEREPYMKEASKGILKQMFHGSLKNFAAALYDGEELSEEDAAELMEFLESKVKR